MSSTANEQRLSGATDESSQLRTLGLGKRYGSFEALRAVDIDIRSGEFLTLLGPSGSGKTTMLMILAGFTAPTSGQVIHNGVDITRKPPERRHFGMVFQGYSLFPHLSVMDNIAFPLRIRRIARAERKRRVERILDVVGLADQGQKKPDALSGGQQQRVAIARALVFGPEVLLLDEPLSALDKNLREQLQNELKRIHREVGTTFVFVTHDQSEALALSSRIAIFDRGEMAQIGAPEHVYSQPESRFVAEFLGRINILPVEDVVPKGAYAHARFGEESVTAKIAGDTLLKEPQVLAVRPEHMQISHERPAEAENTISAVVIDAVYHGATTTLTLDPGRGMPGLTTTLMNNDAALAIEPNSRIWLSWDACHGILMPDEQ